MEKLFNNPNALMNEETNYNWNVINEEEFKNRVRNVFKQVSMALVRTLGPYGSTTIIEKFGEMHISKDGWQVLKKIQFSDAVNNNIMQLLIRISAQVVIKVGDGSTSSIIAANAILESLENDDDLKKLRSKDLMTVINHCVEKVTNKILESSHKINKEDGSNFDEIYKLAMISTNGDEQISRIIQEIYKETANPSIEFVQSKTSKTYHEIIDGYKLQNCTYLDTIFANNDDGTCTIEKPLILMFDHKIDVESSLPVIQAVAQKAMQENRRLVVMAPNYDRFLMDYIRTSINTEFKARGTSLIVYNRVSLISNLTHEYYNDFAVMTGGMILREHNIKEIAEGTIKLDEFIGEVEHMSISDKATFIKGFFKRRDDMYKVIMNDAISKYKKVEENHREMGIVNSELYDLKQRISKLRGRMGIIHVGGYSSLEKVSNYDLVEDAVKACESAYNYGYNIGGNLIIPIVINQIMEEEYITEDEFNVLWLLSEAFKSVFRKVIENKYKAPHYQSQTYEAGKKKSFWGKLFTGYSYENEVNDINIDIDEIIENCIERKECFNLITEEYSTDVINSCYTDIEILKAATSIVSLLLASNQYISIMLSREE